MMVHARTCAFVVAFMQDVAGDTFYRSAFKDVLLARKTSSSAPTSWSTSGKLQVRFQMFAPNVPPSHNVYVSGASAKLGSWKPLDSLKLSDAEYPLWTATLELDSASDLPLRWVNIAPPPCCVCVPRRGLCGCDTVGVGSTMQLQVLCGQQQLQQSHMGVWYQPDGHTTTRRRVIGAIHNPHRHWLLHQRPRTVAWRRGSHPCVLPAHKHQHGVRRVP